MMRERPIHDFNSLILTDLSEQLQQILIASGVEDIYNIKTRIFGIIYKYIFHIFVINNLPTFFSTGFQFSSLDFFLRFCLPIHLVAK